MHLRLLLLIFAAMLPACASRGTAPPRSGGGFASSQVIKSDIDRVAEAHQREVFTYLRRLAEKLYRRNPRELVKSGQGEHAGTLAAHWLRHARSLPCVWRGPD